MAAHNEKYDLMAVFIYILDFKMAHDGGSPTIEEVQKEFKIASKSTANNCLKRLEDQGLIRLGRHKRSRLISVIGGEWRYVNKHRDYLKHLEPKGPPILAPKMLPPVNADS